MLAGMSAEREKVARMATCKECIHFDVCELFANPDKPQSEDNGCYGFKHKDEFVQVVRCKDCQYQRPLNRKDAYENLFIDGCVWCLEDDDGVGADDFCSFGERRATNEAD